MRRIACLVGGFALGISMLTALPVSAASQPSIHLKVPAHAKAGHPTTIRYSSSGVSGDSLVLQRAVESGGWHTIRTLSKSSGKTKVPALKLGVYAIRIAAFTHKGGLVTAAGKKLHVFGKVKFADLFPQLGHGGTYHGFHYSVYFYNTAGTYTALKVRKSGCDSVHISFLPGSDPSTDTPPVGVSSGTLYLGRHNKSKVHTTIAPMNVGKVHGAVEVNHAWSILVAQSRGGGQLMTWYVNGYANCDKDQITDYAGLGAN
jgi:hypothetical protein